jgi:hypothetical protein
MLARRKKDSTMEQDSVDRRLARDEKHEQRDWAAIASDDYSSCMDSFQACWWGARCEGRIPIILRLDSPTDANMTDDCMTAAVVKRP